MMKVHQLTYVATALFKYGTQVSGMLDLSPFHMIKYLW